MTVQMAVSSSQAAMAAMQLLPGHAPRPDRSNKARRGFACGHKQTRASLFDHNAEFLTLDSHFCDSMYDRCDAYLPGSTLSRRYSGRRYFSLQERHRFL